MDHNAFRDFIHRHEWTFAKTYAAFCPHEYLVMNRQPKEEWPLFPEIAKLIREEGFTGEMTCAAERRNSFGPYIRPLSGEDAIRQSSRCLQCDLRCEISRPRLYSE